MRSVIAAALAALIAVPAMADETQGVVLAFDRQANVLILTDFTAWEIPAEIEVPSELQAGEQVKIVYETAGEDGLVKIDVLTRIQ